VKVNLEGKYFQWMWMRHTEAWSPGEMNSRQVLNAC